MSAGASSTTVQTFALDGNWHTAASVSVSPAAAEDAYFFADIYAEFQTDCVGTVFWATTSEPNPRINVRLAVDGADAGAPHGTAGSAGNPSADAYSLVQLAWVASLSSGSHTISVDVQGIAAPDTSGCTNPSPTVWVQTKDYTLAAIELT